MKLNEIRDNKGARKQSMRVCRGVGSGKGRTGGRGFKGQKARTGVAINGFEGGQMSVFRRAPKRGFNNIFAEEVIAINVAALEVFEDGATVDAAALMEKGIIKKSNKAIKVLGNGKLTKKLTVNLNAFSAAAAEKINAVGGKAEVI